MPVFVLGAGVAGVEGPTDIALADPTVEVLTSVRLVDPLLMQRRAETVPMRARFEAGSGQQTLRLQAEIPSGVNIVEGQLVLRTLELRVRYPAGAGRLEPRLDAADSVVATGTLDWRNLPPALGFAGNALRFTIEYHLTPGAGGHFLVRLAQPLDVAVLMCRIDTAELAAEAVPDEQAIILSITGGATIDAQARNTARPLLEPLLGAGVVNQLARPAIAYRQKLRLGQLDGLPRISLGFGWAAAPPALTSPPPDVSASIGLPQFRFTLPDLSTPPPAFDIRFTDCRLRFPQIAGMQALDLTGAFDLTTDAATGIRRLQFTPTLPGGVDLPALLRLFLSRLDWVGGTLDDLAAQARFSLDEVEWLELFRGLLPASGALDLALFTTGLRQLLASAAATTSFGDDRLFFLAFEALSADPWKAQVFPLVWAEWLSNAARSGPDAIARLLRGFERLSPAAFGDVLRSLARLPTIDAGGILLACLADIPGAADDVYRAALRLAGQWIGALVDALSPIAAARAMIDAWLAATGQMLHFEPLQPPRVDISIRIITKAICDLLALLVLAADETGQLLRSLLPDISLPSGARFFRHLISPITDFSDALDRGLFPPWGKLAPMLKAMAAYCEGDRSKEILLLEASKYPFAGVVVLLGALLLALERPTPWTSLLDRNLEEAVELKVKRLPRPFEHPTDPAKSIKYLILSDVHRDVTADDVGVFRFGSIHHFSKNRALYLDILERADAGGCTVIENGDCEELWFIRDFDAFRGFPELVADILRTHDPVYRKLRDLHARGRYFRVYGNHDSYLREAAVRQPLVDFMQSGNTTPFEIYDFILIDGVKRMSDGVLDIASSWPDAVQGTQTSNAFASHTLQHLTERLVGFDSRPYDERRNLIVTHGHQWDFWNCDEHNLVGKLLANMAGVTVDKFMDPFMDVEGAAYAGNPIFDAQVAAAHLYPLDNWPSETPAVAFAHQIQHMPDAMRVLNDSIAFSETLVALAAMFTLPLDRFEPKLNGGQPVLDGDGRPEFDRKRYRDETSGWTRAMKHHGHVIAIGHTHAPHSMPSFDIVRHLVGPVIGDLVNYLRSLIPFESLVRFKSSYMNSGTSGWMEGVVWGIEVHETGQPRLLYWTRGAGEPQRMDWELYPWSKEKRAEFDRLMLQAFPSMEAYFEQLRDRLGDVVYEIAGRLLPSIGLPPEVLPLLSPPLAPATPAVALSPADTGSPGAELQSLLMRIFGFLRRFADDPAAATSAPQVFTVSAAVPPGVEALLGRVRAEMLVGTSGAEGLRQAAGVAFALANLERVTRGVRQFAELSLDDVAALDTLWSLTLLLLVLPQGGRLSTDVVLANGQLTVTITVRR